MCELAERASLSHPRHSTNAQVFPNDFPALLPGPLPELAPSKASKATPAADSIDALLTCEPVRGRSNVICFHPRHDLTVARMAHEDIVAVIDRWRDVYEEEGRFLRETGAEDGYVQIFEVSKV